ncbi:branched-chain amino acid ABC transporter permease [Anaerospora sp.]|jgi:branched-chain amino acid transport system permease protein|uniref:branched-chain amino acid ABC transporter permease n=2 Tax=Anaerospora sp. TaxID=1960278 RepID=UPI00289E03CF|nr:branched-chain amino acid ABC transporter permease [Anaerospora sp.]
MDMQKSKTPKVITAGLLLVTALLPLVITDDYVLRILIMSGIFVILTLSLNLVTGFTGQFCLGWAAFYGIGAYTSALLTMKAGVSFWLAMPLGGFVAALFGLLLGLPTMRLKEIYLAITTLGFGEIIRLIMLNWTDLTRGSMGLPGIPAPTILSYEISSNQAYYYLILALVLVTIIAIRRLIDSRTGRALIAIREDELAAKSMGIDVTAYKMLAFAVGAFFAGLAGSFYAHYTSFIDPHTFSFTESIAILAMAVLGGLGSINGSILGAVILTVIPELLRDIAEYRLIVFGLIMMAVMLLRPQGLFGKARENGSGRGRAKGRGGVRVGSA